MLDHNALWKQFNVMFPDYAAHAKNYRPIGHNAISIEFGDWSYSRVFCYINDNVWHFGTKLWWPRPEGKKTNVVEVISDDDIIMEVVVSEDDNPKELGLMEIVPGHEDDDTNLLQKTEDETPVEDKAYYARLK